MKYFNLLVLGAAIAAFQLAYAADHKDTEAKAGTAASAPAVPLTEGEVKKIDKGANKITLKHGDIKNLEMPGMTMALRVRDPALLEKLQAGDKVKFKAERVGGAILVTEIQSVK